MAKPKYEFWLKEENLQKIQEWALQGHRHEDIAKCMGINVSTLYAWCNAHKEIYEALKTTKDFADVQIENSLYKKAMGYNVVLHKQKVTKDGIVVNYEEEQHIPADTIAQIFWLKNRKPNDWREKVVAEVNGDGMVKDILAYMEKNKNE